jgi:glycosyltransferase involved in cell wall biosynthesis
MRIIHTCLRYPPSTGGTETYVHELVERTRHIPERDVRVVTSALRTHGPMTQLSPALLVNDAPYIQRLHSAATPLISYPRLQALSYYLGHHKPDLIHGYSFWYQPADVAARYATKHSIPFIFHPLYYNNFIREKPLWQLYKNTIGRRTFAAASVVVVISPFEQQLIERDNLPVKKFALIPPGIDPVLYQQPAPDPFTTRGINGPRLLTVSRLDRGKGLDDLLAALPHVIKSHPTVQLAIIGEDFGARANLEQMAEQLGVAAQVHFWGKVSDGELRAAYQHADIFVHPSHYEAFGIVLAESLAAQTPVVARNVAAIPYVVPHQKAGLLFNNQEELAAHLNDLLGNTKKRASLAQFGYDHVLRNFTWDQSIKKLVELYSELGQ